MLSFLVRNSGRKISRHRNSNILVIKSRWLWNTYLIECGLTAFSNGIKTILVKTTLERKYIDFKIILNFRSFKWGINYRVMKWGYHRMLWFHSLLPSCNCKNYVQPHGHQNKPDHFRTIHRIMCHLHTENSNFPII